MTTTDTVELRRLAEATGPMQANWISGNTVLALLDRLEKAERFIGGITSDEWSAIDREREARALLQEPSGSQPTGEQP